MAVAARFLLPLLAWGTVTLACSSTNDGQSQKIAPPPNTTGGSAAIGVGGAAAGGSGSGSASGQACATTPDCSTSGSLCKEGSCVCPPDKPDVCGADTAAACVTLAEDPDNCGKCATQCDPGAACIAGKCGTKPTDLATATGCGGGVHLAIQDGNLYWTETTTGKVRTVPIAGGTATDVATSQLSPTQITVDADGVYWVNQGDGTAASSQVLKKALPLADGAPIALKTSASAMDTFPALAGRAGKLYYALHTDVHQISTDEKVSDDVIMGRSINYGVTPPLVWGEIENLAVSDTRVIWGTPGTRNFVETHTITPWGDDTNGKIDYARLGKTVETTSDVGIDAQYGYWRDAERFLRDTADAKVALAEVVTLAPYSKIITAFAIDATSMYASSEDGSIFTHSLIPADPNDDTTIVAPVLIARDQTNVTAIVLDSSHVYWVTTDCMLRSLPL